MYRELGSEEISRLLKVKCKMERKVFPSGRLSPYVDVSINGRKLYIVADQPPTSHITEVFEWLSDNMIKCKTIRPKMTSGGIKDLYYRLTDGAYASKSDIKICMEILGYSKANAYCDSYKYNAICIKNKKLRSNIFYIKSRRRL